MCVQSMPHHGLQPLLVFPDQVQLPDPWCQGATLHQKTAGDGGACDEARCVADLRDTRCPDQYRAQ